MTYKNLTSFLSIYYPALLLDDLISRRVRHTIRDLFDTLTIFFLALVLSNLIFNIALLSNFRHVIQGLFFIFLSFSLAGALIEAFYNSYYFKDITPILRERRLKGEEVPFTYGVAKIIYSTDTTDITFGFISSAYGGEVLARLGLESAAIDNFLRSRKSRTLSDAILFPDATKITTPLYAKAVFAADKEFSRFLFSLSIQEKEFVGAAGWISWLQYRAKRYIRWWGKDSLGRIPGIGKTWAHGQIFTIKKFANEIEFGIPQGDSGVKEEIEKLEATLGKTREANALIVADTGSGEMNVVLGLVGKIKNGTTLPPLEGKRVFRLDGNALIDSAGAKTTFENEFVKLMNEAIAAGNVILVFEDLPGFMQSAKSIGADISGLLSPYLNSSDIQIIAIADKTRFHEGIETNATLMNSFEVIRLKEEDELSLISILEDEVLRIEKKAGIFFTYQALQTIAESAARFFTEGVAVDKAKDLLLEIPTKAKRAKHKIITKADVLSLVEEKTGVPQEGVVKEEEKNKLLNLEKILHERVVGQDEAITSIANAMRRARAGLRNPNRPIGSFLFLGPTGVGKTETAKALAEIFFGGSAPILRLDMSEYASADALTKLIGSFEGGHAGNLATMLRDQKYGVLLLDEFEKTNTEVMNLFLQILDEGFFSDMIGKKVNARNVIVIATSNAGSDLIFEFVSQGKNLATEKQTLIDMIIKRGQFKPELLNRFDGIILFHPLAEEHLKKVAKLLVERLSKRLREQGINLNINDDLINFLAKEGFDQKFGARPMNRVLQENVEKLLAEKLIRGEIEKGGTVEFIASSGSPSSLEVRAVKI